jgi:hypothetical protein
VIKSYLPSADESPMAVARVRGEGQPSEFGLFATQRRWTIGSEFSPCLSPVHCPVSPNSAFRRSVLSLDPRLEYDGTQIDAVVISKILRQALVHRFVSAPVSKGRVEALASRQACLKASRPMAKHTLFWLHNEEP